MSSPQRPPPAHRWPRPPGRRPGRPAWGADPRGALGAGHLVDVDVGVPHSQLRGEGEARGGRSHEDDASRAREVRVHPDRQAHGPGALHHDGVPRARHGHVEHPVHRGGTGTPEGSHRLRRRVGPEPDDRRPGVEMDRVRPCAGEVRREIGSPVDAVDAPLRAQRGLAGFGAVGTSRRRCSNPRPRTLRARAPVTSPAPPGPTATTSPTPSWPRTTGSGIGRRPSWRCTSVPRAPPSVIRTTTAPGAGTGTSNDSSATGRPTAPRTTAPAVVTRTVAGTVTRRPRRRCRCGDPRRPRGRPA